MYQISDAVIVVPQISMNATLQMEAVNTIALTQLGASPVAVTQGTSWMIMDWTAVVRVYSHVHNKRSACSGIETLNHYKNALLFHRHQWMQHCKWSLWTKLYTIGSFTCSCDRGYKLDGNGLDCDSKTLFRSVCFGAWLQLYCTISTAHCTSQHHIFSYWKLMII